MSWILWVVAINLLVKSIMWFVVLINLTVIQRLDCWSRIAIVFMVANYGISIKSRCADCIAWCQSLRRIWKLPYNCHTAILERLSGTITIFDTLCKRWTINEAPKMDDNLGWLWMTLTCYKLKFSQNFARFRRFGKQKIKTTTAKWMKIDPYYHRQTVAH